MVLASSTTDAKCEPPDTGLWLIQAYEPPIDFQFPALTGYLELTLSGDNTAVFVGNRSPTSNQQSILYYGL